MKLTQGVMKINAFADTGKTNPIQSQFKPNQTQFEAKTNPTCSELVEPIPKGAPNPHFYPQKTADVKMVSIVKIEVNQCIARRRYAAAL